MATCVTVSVYADALTYGGSYEILEVDADRKQVRVLGDNGRIRWYPMFCFDLTGAKVPKLVETRIEDPTDGSVAAEVELYFSDGQRRWCYFTTPAMLSERGGCTTIGAERLLSFSARHMIVVTSINREVIEQSLDYIESQGELFNGSMPIE